MSAVEQNRRRHYRVCYPLAERPQLETEAGTFAVADLSESGLRFVPGADGVFEREQRVEGDLVLPEGKGRRRVLGLVQRLDGHRGVALRFEPGQGLPLALIVAEQRRLIQKGNLR